MTAGVGMGAGTVALSFAIEALVSRVGWRACLRVLGVVCAALVAASSLAYVPIVPPAYLNAVPALLITPPAL
jgi:hypothetical protein